MRSSITALLVFAGLAMGVPSTASAAAPIRECGMHGAIHNVTSRNVPCPDARRFARWYGFVGAGFRSHFVAPSWWCRVSQAPGGFYERDVRCTASRGRVIRWQYWSGE
jgi:hypothetical protein